MSQVKEIEKVKGEIKDLLPKVEDGSAHKDWTHIVRQVDAFKTNLEDLQSLHKMVEAGVDQWRSDREAAKEERAAERAGWDV